LPDKGRLRHVSRNVPEFLIKLLRPSFSLKVKFADSKNAGLKYRKQSLNRIHTYI